MKVLEISFRNPYMEASGGVGTYIYGLSNYLASVGVDVDVIYCEKFNKENGVNSKNTVRINIPEIISLFRLDRLYYNFYLFFYMLKNKGLYDIVHINGDAGVYLVYIKSIKTIMTLHGSWDEVSRLTAKNYGYRKLGPWLFERYLGFTEKIACKKSHSVIAVSEHVKNYFEKITGRKDIVIINSCISSDHNKEINNSLAFKLTDYKKNNNLLCLWVGMDPERKGLDIAKRLVTKMENVILFTVGYIDPVETPNVLNLGIVSNQDLITLYHYCDIFIFPTLYEGFSIALLEAISYGLVPITFSIPSTNELISNNYNGYTCENEEEMSNVLNNLNHDREKLLKLRENAVESSRKYSCNKLYPKVYELMKQLI